MTREMDDGINSDAAGIAQHDLSRIQLVAFYIDSPHFTWTPEEIALFAGKVHVRIAVRWTTRDGNVIDCETGDASPAQAAAWAHQRRADGYAYPTVYCSTSKQADVIAAFNAIKEPLPLWWLAHYDNLDVLPAGAVAKQYADPGPLDKSIVADFWPGVDQGVLDMLLSDEITIPNGPNAGKVLADVNDTMYFTDLYAGQAATVVQDPNIGNAAIMAALKAQSTVLAQLAANAGAQVTGAQIQQWIDDAVAQHVQITGTVQVGPASTTPAAAPPAATSN